MRDVSFGWIWRCKSNSTGMLTTLPGTITYKAKVTSIGDLR